MLNKTFSQQMLRYNKVLKQFLTKKKFDSKTRIEMKYILKTVDWSVLLSERKAKSPLSFLEKLFNLMITNMNKEKLIMLANFNIQFYQK